MKNGLTWFGIKWACFLALLEPCGNTCQSATCLNTSKRVLCHTRQTPWKKTPPDTAGPCRVYNGTIFNLQIKPWPLAGAAAETAAPELVTYFWQRRWPHRKLLLSRWGQRRDTEQCRGNHSWKCNVIQHNSTLWITGITIAFTGKFWTYFQH